MYATKSGKGDVSKFSLKISNKEISTKDLIIYYTVDKNRKKIGLEFFIEGGNDFPENLKYEILFIMLDNTISELLVMFYIGSVDIVDQKLDKESVSMSDFNATIAQILNEEGWEQTPKIDDQFAGFELKPNEDTYAPIREDIYIISAKNGAIDLYKNYLGVNEEDNNAFFSKFKAYGVFFKTLTYEISTIPRDQILDLRDKILDEIEAATLSRGVAKWLSSATGISHSYIDFMVFDLGDFEDVVKEIVSRNKLQNAMIVDFNKTESVLHIK